MWKGERPGQGGSLYYTVLYWPCYVIFRLGVRLRVKGAHNVPREGGVLMVCNHLSLADPPLLAVCFRRQLHFMAKRELLDHGFVNVILSRLNVYSVKRGEADRAALRLTEQKLASGAIVCIFPEGHRSRDGVLQTPQEGVAFLARRAGVPILPVAIYGSERISPRTLWRRPIVRVVVGAPFPVEDAGAGGRRQVAQAIMQRIAALLPPAMRGIYGADAGADADKART